MSPLGTMFVQEGAERRVSWRQTVRAEIIVASVGQVQRYPMVARFVVVVGVAHEGRGQRAVISTYLSPKLPPNFRLPFSPLPPAFPTKCHASLPAYFPPPPSLPLTAPLIHSSLSKSALPFPSKNDAASSQLKALSDNARVGLKRCWR